MHPQIFFGLSMYLPYRFRAQINTAILLRTMSCNKMVKGSIKVVVWSTILLTSGFLSQLLARWYWTYKRSLFSTKQATLNAYIRY
mmetsp:Transcript_7866/g.13189  ORF Transcript_7866/g.13189 Transcript_7866/m.13189 type:complete len:85 (-) Transcript_7866:118-372(-)